MVAQLQETRVQSLDQEDSPERETATHSSILAWEIPWTDEPGGLPSMGSQRVGYDLVTKTTTIPNTPYQCSRNFNLVIVSNTICDLMPYAFAFVISFT